MNLKQIQEQDLENKKVLMRVDFNVAIKDGDVREKFKIQAPKESIDYVLSQKGAKLVLVSHLGRPEGEFKEELSLEQLVDDVEELLGLKVRFASDCVGEKVKEGLDELQEGEVLLLENSRFHSGEKSNNPEFAQQISEFFDIFVQEAFAVCHRDQASVTGVAKVIPSCAGFWVQKEVEKLEWVKNNPEHPAVAVIGGAKIDTKLPLIKKFEENYDHILVGGKVANEAIDEKIEFSEKVILPTDFSGDRLDIGEETIEKFKNIISGAKTIIWNGPLGKFEEEPYDKGTVEVLKAISQSKAFSLTGGGESVEMLEKSEMMDAMSFISTGGGAMLEFLSDGEMPGIAVLTSNEC